MNWAMVSAIGQVVASVGLIPTLIYLAIQVREQNKANHRASLDLLSTQWTELVKTMNESPDFGLIYIRGLQDFDALDSLAKLRFSAYLLRVFRYWDGIHFHFLDGSLPTPYWQSIRRQMQDIVPYPGVQSWWQTRKHWYTDEFGILIASMMSNSQNVQAYSSYQLPADTPGVSSAP